MGKSHRHLADQMSGYAQDGPISTLSPILDPGLIPFRINCHARESGHPTFDQHKSV